MMQRTNPLVCLGLLVLVACPALVTASCYTCESTTSIRNEWYNHFVAEFSIPVTNAVSGGWDLELQFSKPVTYLMIWRADVKSTSADSSMYILKNKYWNENLSLGSNLTMSFLGEFNGPTPSFTVRLLGQADCGQCSETGFLHSTQLQASATPLGCRTCCSLAEVTNEWPGNFDGQFMIPIQNEVVGGWVIELVFSNPVSNLDAYEARVTDILNGGQIYRFKNKRYNANLAAGSELIQTFQASAKVTPSFTAHMVGQPECCDGDLTPCNPSTTVPPPTCPITNIVDEWPGNFMGEFVIPIRDQVSGGWRVELHFSEPVSNMQVYRADVVDIINGGEMYIIKNKDYNADLSEGALLQEKFQASAANTPTFTARMIGQPDCAGATI